MSVVQGECAGQCSEGNGHDRSRDHPEEESKSPAHEKNDRERDRRDNRYDLREPDHRVPNSPWKRADSVEEARLDVRDTIAVGSCHEVPDDQEYERTDQPHDVRRASHVPRARELVDAWRDDGSRRCGSNRPLRGCRHRAAPTTQATLRLDLSSGLES